MWLFYKFFAFVFFWTWIGSYCSPMTNDFNANLRDYLVRENEINNSTNVKTLQKEEVARFAYYAPENKPVVFKEIPDNVLSGSSHSRGIHHEHAGYNLHDFEDGHGYAFEHYGHDYHGGHYGYPLEYGHHHKHYDHGLAAKSLLLPIAGIALLGAAAALVSNPILLQLGVISGRKRRDTEASNFNINLDSWSRDDEDIKKGDGITLHDENTSRDETELPGKNNFKDQTDTRKYEKVPKPRITHQNSHTKTVEQSKAKVTFSDKSKEIEQAKTPNRDETQRYISKKTQQRYKLKKSMSFKEEMAVQASTATVTPGVPRSVSEDGLVPVALKIRGQ